MSTIPGALEIVREAFDRMRTPVAVDVPPSREERAAACGRMKETLVNWSVPTDDPAFTGFDPAKAGSEQSIVFRTKLPEMVWRELVPPPAVEIVKLRGQIAKLTEAYDARGQVLREMYEERDRALSKVAEMQAQLAAFTAQNVRPLDQKPEPAPIFRAIAPSRTDPRRLGLA